MIKMQKRGIWTRVVAIVLAALMAISVAAAAITAFAEEMVPVTGQNTSNTKWIIIAAVAAVCVILVCVILPKAKNNLAIFGCQNKESIGDMNRGAFRAAVSI